MERVTRRFTQQLVKHGFLGPAIDVPAPDMYTGKKSLTSESQYIITLRRKARD